MFYKYFSIVFFLLLLSNEHKNYIHTDCENKSDDVILMKKDLASNDVVDSVKEQFNYLFKDQTNMPSFECFDLAIKGFMDLQSKKELKNSILTIIDFSFSSNKKRLWVIDLVQNKVLYHTLVAHGKNSGEEFASAFSNKEESYKSSLGFYLTGEIYQGKHGKSLKLDGVEKGVNDKARERAIVIHGADYVNQNFIKNHGRLGRSLGCPALPEELNASIIEKIKNKSVLFIYHPSRNASLKKSLTS
jgi:hypothetical protein